MGGRAFASRTVTDARGTGEVGPLAWSARPSGPEMGGRACAGRAASGAGGGWAGVQLRDEATPRGWSDAPSAGDSAIGALRGTSQSTGASAIGARRGVFSSAPRGRFVAELAEARFVQQLPHLRWLSLCAWHFLHCHPPRSDMATMMSPL